jgi:hypothetical protein
LTNSCRYSLDALLAFLLLDGVTLGFVSAAVAGWEIFIVGLLA